MKRKINITAVLLSAVFFIGCYKAPEMTLEEIEAERAKQSSEYLSKTVSRPWKNEPWKNGVPGGTWNDSITGEPKSFNLLIAERDASTTSILAPLHESLADYNYITKEWESKIASFKITTDTDNGTLDIQYTLRDDLYWSFYEDIHPKVKVTSDDVVFWYDEIYGDPECGSSAYNSQFMTTDNGETVRITIEKLDDLNFVFHYPRIVAEPVLSSNMDFGPAFLYKAAKDSGGVQAVKDLFTVASDPKEIPSMGKYFLTEYTPGQRLRYERNPNYWDKDQNNESIAYPQTRIVQIVGDANTSFLLFKQGKLEDFSPSPEQLEEIVQNEQNAFTTDGSPIIPQPTESYTVFNSGGGLSAPMWTFNQNPQNKNEPYYKWFCTKEFRQAMSCLLNRERIITQTYRGLAEPKYSFFPEPNAYYNENIILKYRFSHTHAQRLLESAGFSKHSDGFLYDSDGIKVEFDLTITGTSPIYNDIAQIVTDECKKEGITVNVRQTDFQRLVEQLTATYDWQSLMIGLSGGSIFPTQGSNVWVSAGNLHMWNPLQETPATDWEARLDYLYEEAGCTVEHEKAAPLWDEFQEIILEQCPVIYLLRSRSFYAIRNRWNLQNVYFDNVNGAETTHLYFTE